MFSLILISSCCVKKDERLPFVHFGKSIQETDYFLVFLVDAKHLDYTSTKTVIKSLQQNADFGHAWIYLRGAINGLLVELEGGHSGELGRSNPKYFDGVMNYIEYGNPNGKSRNQPIRKEPNPIKYLWTTLHDGFYQEGAGGHKPTFAAKVDITQEQFDKILTFISPFNYSYSDYALTWHQCTSFVTQIASLIGIILSAEISIPISQNLKFGCATYQLWVDPQYAELTLFSPDVLEKSLIDLVQQNKAQDALNWYVSK